MSTLDFYGRALADLDRAISERRYFHRHPELTSEEQETAAEIARLLRADGIECECLQCHAVIARIRGTKPGKTVMLRADIDALEIQEETGLPYASENPGISHACGHDYHIASLLSCARILNSMKDELAGEVRLLFQPAEEKPPSGARILLDEYNILDGVDAIFGAHVYNSIPVGDISVQAGPRLAGSMNFYVDIHGKGGHGAMPQACIDPIVAASATVLNLQSIVSRELPTAADTSVSVGMIYGGKTHNSIASDCHFEGAVKTMNAELREHIRESIERIIRSTCETYRCRADIRFTGFGSPLVNDTALAEIAEQSIGKAIGPEHVIRCAPWPVSEDFTYYLEKVPGIYALVGGGNPEKGYIHPNHHPAFASDEGAIAVAAAAYAAFARGYLNS